MSGRIRSVLRGLGITRAVRLVLGSAGMTVQELPTNDLTLYAGFPRSSLESRAFYNVGAGSFRHPYWTNIDLSSDWYSGSQTAPFLNHDLMSLAPLPLSDNSAEIIYTSHTVEHISDAAAEVLFRSSFRALKPGGIFRLTCPDMNLALGAYRRKDRKFAYWAASGSNEQVFLQQFATQLSTLSPSPSDHKMDDATVAAHFDGREDFDFFTRKCVFDRSRPGNHMNWWTIEKAERMLRNAGFSTVYRSGYGQSVTPPLRELHLFDSTHPKWSMYVEAQK